MYPSDLRDEEWAVAEPFFQRADPRGGRQIYPMRKIIDAICYRKKTGCQWRMLPQEFPPWRTVYYHYNKFKTSGAWTRLHLAVNELKRKKGVENLVRACK